MPQYIALLPILAGDALAYNPGDPVHADNVAAQGYEVGVQVAERESTQAAKALRALGMLPAEETAPGPAQAPMEQVSAGGFDPAAHTISEVNSHLDTYPDDVPRVLAAERDGKMRAGIIHGPHGAPPDVAEA
jgi:hypothetical protein